MTDNNDFLRFPPNIPYQIHFVQDMSSAKHWHNTLELLFPLDGEVSVTVQKDSFLLKAGDILLINRNEVHQHTCIRTAPILVLTLDLHKFDLPDDEAESLTFSCNSSVDPDNSRYDTLRSLIAQIVYRNTVQDDTSLFENKSFAYTLLKELTTNFRAAGTPPCTVLPHEKHSGLHSGALPGESESRKSCGRAAPFTAVSVFSVLCSPEYNVSGLL